MAACPLVVGRQAYLVVGKEACLEAWHLGRPGACLAVGRGACWVLDVLLDYDVWWSECSIDLRPPRPMNGGGIPGIPTHNQLSFHPLIYFQHSPGGGNPGIPLGGSPIGGPPMPIPAIGPPGNPPFKFA